MSLQDDMCLYDMTIVRSDRYDQRRTSYEEHHERVVMSSATYNGHLWQLVVLHLGSPGEHCLPRSCLHTFCKLRDDVIGAMASEEVVMCELDLGDGWKLYLKVNDKDCDCSVSKGASAHRIIICSRRIRSASTIQMLLRSSLEAAIMKAENTDTNIRLLIAHIESFDPGAGHN